MHVLSRFVAFVVILFTALSPGVQAEDLLKGPIRFVVPYQTGGLPDVMARLVGQKMGDAFDRQVIVENRSGASGIIAANYVAASQPDGLTLFVGDIGHFAINPALYSDLPYDMGRDFTPVIAAVHGPLLLVANESFPVNSLPELIDYVKSNPDKVNYGSPGNGSVHHLAMARLALEAKVNMRHIPYRSNAQAVPALLANDVQVMFISPPSVAPHIKTGKLKVLAVGSAEPTSLVPDVPTVSSFGFPGFNAVTTVGFFAPAKTPPAVINQLNKEILSALQDQEVKERLPGMGVTVMGGTPASFGELIKGEQQSYSQLVRSVGVTVN